MLANGTQDRLENKKPFIIKKSVVLYIILGAII